jgi:lipopolysaccharide export system permease protein
VSILQKYVLREMLGPLGLGLVVFSFIFLIGLLFRIADQLLNSGMAPLLAGELILSMLPGILSMTTPMAILVGVLLGIGRLAADREILAIRMSGVNLMHICLPLIVFAALVSAAMIMANQRLVAYLNLKTADIGTQILFKSLSTLPPDRVETLGGGQDGGSEFQFVFDHRDPATGDMIGVHIKSEKEREGESGELDRVAREQRDALEAAAKEGRKITKEDMDKLRAATARARDAKAMQRRDETLVVAQSGRIEADIAERLVTIRLTTGSMHIAGQDRYIVSRFEELSKGLRPALQHVEDGVFRKQPREMSVSELREMMRRPTKKARSFATEFYQRFSIPLACIAFTLIAIPLAVYVRPTGKAVAFAISFLLILLYYGILNWGISLGKTGSTFAPYAIFLPNIILAAVGSFLLYRMVMK